MREKLKNFLNSLTWDEAREFYRFLRTRTWTQWIDDIVHNIKIQYILYYARNNQGIHRL